MQGQGSFFPLRVMSAEGLIGGKKGGYCLMIRCKSVVGVFKDQCQGISECNVQCEK